MNETFKENPEKYIMPIKVMSQREVSRIYPKRKETKMDRSEILNCLKVVYQRAFNADDIPLCLEILKEIIYLNRL